MHEDQVGCGLHSYFKQPGFTADYYKTFHFYRARNYRRNECNKVTVEYKKENKNLKMFHHINNNEIVY